MPLIFHHIELLIFLILFIGMTFWLWMLIDCAINRRLPLSQKIIWILIMLFTHPIGSLLYLFVGRLPKQPQNIYQSRTSMQQHSPQAPVTPYYPYHQGYQAAPPIASPYQPGAMPPPTPYEQAPALDYEQPQAMYPHDHNNG